MLLDLLKNACLLVINFALISPMDSFSSNPLDLRVVPVWTISTIASTILTTAANSTDPDNGMMDTSCPFSLKYAFVVLTYVVAIFLYSVTSGLLATAK